MAASDVGDPALNAELYGPVVPSFVDAMPPPSTNQAPWDWAPEEWRRADDEEELGYLAAQGAPSAAPGAMPPTAVPQVMPVDPYAQPAPPVAQLAPSGPPVPPPIAPPVDPYANAPPIMAPPIIGDLVDPYAGAPPIAPPVDLYAAPPPSIPVDAAGAAPLVAPLPSAPVGVPPPIDAPPPWSVAEAEDSPYGRYVREKPALDHPKLDDQGKVIGASDESFRRYIEDPLQAAQIGEAIKTARDEKFGAEIHALEIAKRKEEKAVFEEDRAWLKTARERSVQIDQDAQRIANTKIDTSGRFNTGQKVFLMIGAAIGGLVRGRTGSNVNTTIDQMNTMISRDIDAQKTELENARAGISTRRNAMIDEFKIHGDVQRAEDAVRQATYKITIANLDFERQNYARGGITDLRLKAIRDAVLGAEQRSQSDAIERHRKNDLDEREQRNKDRKAAADELDARVKAAGAGVAKKVPEDERILDPAELRERYPAGPWPNYPVSEKGYKQHLGNVEAGQKVRKESPEYANAIPGVYIRTPSGERKTFLGLGEPGKLDEIRGIVADGTIIAGYLDTALRIRSGYSSSVRKREEWSKLKTNWGAAQALSKNLLGLGALSESDYALLNDFLGSADPTKAADPTPGIRQARANIEGYLRRKLVGIRRPDQVGEIDLDLPDMSSPPTTPETTRDRAFKELMIPSSDVQSRDYDIDGNVIPPERRASVEQRVRQITKEPDWQGSDKSPLDAAAESIGRDSQFETLNRIEQMAHSDNPEDRALALEQLTVAIGRDKRSDEDVAPARARDAKVRERAQKILDGMLTVLPPGSSERTSTTTRVK